MSEQPKKESNWQKFKDWVSDGTTSVYTRENMTALKMGINSFLITVITVGGLFIFAWARKLDNELHSIGIMQLWAGFGTLLGIIIGVFFGSVKKSTELLAKKSESMGSQAGIDMPTMDTSDLEDLEKEPAPLTIEPEEPNLTIEPEEPDLELPEPEPSIEDGLSIPNVPEIANE